MYVHTYEHMHMLIQIHTHTHTHTHTFSDECSSSPCKNGGKCIDSINKYFCQCPQGWEGVDCSVNTSKLNLSSWPSNILVLRVIWHSSNQSDHLLMPKRRLFIPSCLRWVLKLPLSKWRNVYWRRQLVYVSVQCWLHWWLLSAEHWYVSESHNTYARICVPQGYRIAMWTCTAGYRKIESADYSE